MAQVSVGQVENLEEAISSLESIYEMMEVECRELTELVDHKVVDAEQESEHSNSLLESAQQIEQEKFESLEQAQEQFEAAQESLEEAHGALSTCMQGEPGEDGSPPDCSDEESEVNSAQVDVEKTGEALNKATLEYEKAKDNRMKMGQRCELASLALRNASDLNEKVKTGCSLRLQSASRFLETGRSRLSHAKSALDSYLSTNPSAANFVGWIKWTPNPNSSVKPDELNNRLNLSPDKQRHFCEYLAERNPEFKSMLGKCREEYANCKGAAELQALQFKVRSNLSGSYAEKLVERALSPMAENVRTQQRTVFDDGRYTKTDLVLENLKSPVIIGRGDKMSSPAGGSMAIEVKCGRPSYLLSQKDHMVFQAGGHQKASASMTICSRDIKELSPEQEKELRDKLREAGSPLVGMLPKKDEIDKICWEAVLGNKEDVEGGKC